MTVTDKNWKKWAEQDPYHGVLGRGFGVGDIERDEVRAEFFNQGQKHIDKVLENAVLLGPVKYGKVLDFGCGVGRLLRPFLGKFDEVTGVDIAPAMLKLAGDNCDNSEKLTLVENVDGLLAAGKQFDLVHSYIVIQHIRPKFGLEIMGKLLDLVAPGGTAALHFTVGDLNSRRRMLNMARYHIPPLHWLYNVTTGRNWDLPISEMNVYPVAKVLSLFRAKMGDQFVGWSVDQNGHQGMMLVARKSE